MTDERCRKCALRNLSLSKQLLAQSPTLTTRDTAAGGSTPSRERVAIAPSSIMTGSSRLEDDNISVISNAASAIDLATKLKRSRGSARSQRSGRRFQPPSSPSTSPVFEALTKNSTEQQVIDTFIDEVFDLSESLQLYSMNPTEPSSPRQLAKITSAAVKLCNSLQPQPGVSALSPSLTLSPVESFKDSLFSSLTASTTNTTLSEWTPYLKEAMDSASASTTHVDLGDSAIPHEHPSEPSFAHLDQMVPTPLSEAGSLKLDIGRPAKEPLEFEEHVSLLEPTVVGVHPISCTLDFTDATDESPLCTITAVASSQRRHTTRSIRSGMGAMALTPQAHLDLHGEGLEAVQSTDDNLEARRVFNHRFHTERRPVPYVIHPDVEGMDNMPYTITFTTPQHFEEENVDQPQAKPTQLKYIFLSRSDRDDMQSLIFGKLLLVSVGIDSITVTNGDRKTSSERSQQALRLWKPKLGQRKSITVHYRDSQSKRKTLKEYAVLEILSNVNKLKSKDSVKLAIDEIVLATADGRPSSTTSALTMSSSGSTASAGKSKQATCSIQFSNDQYRAEFLEHCNDVQGAAG